MTILKSVGGFVTSIAVATLACGGSDPAGPPPTVQFVIDAPLCSSRIPVELSIDSKLVAIDTFVVHLGPEHTTSRAFTTSVGQHTIGARAVSGYLWPDQRVTLAAGQTFTDSLPFYCS